MVVAKKAHAICVPLQFQSHISAMLKVAKLLHSKGPLRDLVATLNQSPDNPPVSCIVADVFMSSTLPLADELGIPEVLLWTCSGAALLFHLHLQNFMQKGILPLKDKSYITNGYLDTPVEFIPGVKDIRLKDLPIPFLDGSCNLNELSGVIQQVYKASAVILNTFDALESEVLEETKSLLGLVPLYTVGPLQLLEERYLANNPLRSFRSNLIKEDQGCIKWLDSKPPSSVIYVNFGSHYGLTREQLVEFAWGLVNCQHPFFLVIRPDLVIGEAAMLPMEFAEATADRGMVSGWCPQEEVLCHPSIGGFLTHCGWNSIMDTVCGGVPVISWPLGYEQPTNSHYVCEHWGIGMKLAKDVKRDEIEGLVRELMQGEKGKAMKKRAAEWKHRAEESSEPGGSSSANLDNLVKEVLVPKK